jgi:hypothetical protein
MFRRHRKEQSACASRSSPHVIASQLTRINATLTVLAIGTPLINIGGCPNSRNYFDPFVRMSAMLWTAVLMASADASHSESVLEWGSPLHPGPHLFVQQLLCFVALYVVHHDATVTAWPIRAWLATTSSNASARSERGILPAPLRRVSIAVRYLPRARESMSLGGRTMVQFDSLL